MKFVSGCRMGGVAVFIALLCGCVFSTNREYATRYFVPGKETSAEELQWRVAAVINDSGADDRMQYRTKDSEVLKDEYNRWAQPPDILLANDLRRHTIAQPKGDVELRLYQFDADLAAKTVEIGLEWRFRTPAATAPERWYGKIFQASFEEPSSEAVARAMGTLVPEIIAKINQAGGAGE